MEYDDIYKSQKAWEDLVDKYMPSAREYFYILRLALYHVDGVHTESSYEVTQAYKSAEVYECAINILNTLYGDK